MQTEIFTREELINFNEQMLGRGVPITDDGIGYNKADYSNCSSYYFGLSDAQYADLSKRLVKYSNTQLKIDKEKMKQTAEYFKQLAAGRDKNTGISLKVESENTLISFRYNEEFIKVVQDLPRHQRKWDRELKKWIVSTSLVEELLDSLGKVGADVENAITYIKKYQ